MKTALSSNISQDPHLSHLFQIGVLCNRTTKKYPLAVRREAATEILRYRDAGLAQQKEHSVAKAASVPTEPEVFRGQGVIFAVIDNREDMPTGKVSTIDIIADAIEAALDAGHADSESIARYLTTSAFQHLGDKRMRFNSVLKAGDAVGAKMTQKLFNSYNDLAALVDSEENPARKATLKAEATGFAEALTIVLSPFSCEDPDDPRVVNWTEVDRFTAAFEKEQRYVIKERKGKIQ